HYVPQPWNDHEPREDWTATYYHRADRDGIGFDRTTSGSGAVKQYFPPLRALFDSRKDCPEKFLLWFHHLPWDHRMKSGRTLWQDLVKHYQDGAEAARGMQDVWQSLAGQIDKTRHEAVAAKLAIQAHD